MASSTSGSGSLKSEGTLNSPLARPNGRLDAGEWAGTRKAKRPSCSVRAMVSPAPSAVMRLTGSLSVLLSMVFMDVWKDRIHWVDKEEGNESIYRIVSDGGGVMSAQG